MSAREGKRSYFRRQGEESWSVIHLNTVDSTNTYLDRLAKEGYPHGTVVVADSQTSGRGRFQRKWFSPPGKNIYMSILLRPEGVPLPELSVIPMLTGIACARAIRTLTNLEVFLKWPNDILLNERKLGGILVESKIEAERVYIIAGIGINVNMTEEDLPEEIMDIATSLYIVARRGFSRELIMNEILYEFFELYRGLLQKGRSFIISEWQTLSSTIGKTVRVVLPDGREIRGKAIQVDEDGALLIQKDDLTLEVIRTGDVFHCDNH